MPTLRLYLPSTGTAPSDVTDPAVDSDWTATASTTLRTASATAISSATVNATATAGASETRRRMQKFVSPGLPLRARVTAVRLAVTGATAGTGTKSVVLNTRLINGDGTIAATVTNMVEGSAISGVSAAAVRTISVGSLSQPVLAGQRLHFEIGARTLAAGTSTIGIDIGDTGTDHAFTEGSSSAGGRGWIEVDYTLDAEPSSGIFVKEYKQFSSGAQSAGSYTPLTLDETPVAGDVVLILVLADRAGATPSGLGASWSTHENRETDSTASLGSSVPEMSWHIARDASAAGGITFTPTTTWRGSYHMFLLRSATPSAFLSVLPKIYATEPVQSSLAKTAVLKAGELAIGGVFWSGGSGTHANTSSVAISGSSGMVQDSATTETSVVWREATGAETVTFTSTRTTTAARGNIGMFVITEDPNVLTEPEMISQYAIINGSTALTNFNVFMDGFEFFADDVVVVLQTTRNNHTNTYVPSGLGATWTKKTIVVSSGGIVPGMVMWVGKGPTTPGLLNLASGSPAGVGSTHVFVIRGLPAGKEVSTYSRSGAATAFTGPSIEANIGEFVVAYRYHEGSGTGSVAYPVTPAPASGWLMGDYVSGTNGYGALAYRTPDADSQTHEVSMTSLSSTNAIAMIQFGVDVASLSETIDATTDLQVTLSRPFRRLAVRFDSTWSPNLMPSPNGEDLNDWDDDPFEGNADGEENVTTHTGPSDTAVSIARFGSEDLPMPLMTALVDITNDGAYTDIFPAAVRLGSWVRLESLGDATAEAQAFAGFSFDSDELSDFPLVDETGTVIPAEPLTQGIWEWIEFAGSMTEDFYFGTYYGQALRGAWTITAVDDEPITSIMDGSSATGWLATKQTPPGSQYSAAVTQLTWANEDAIQFGDISASEEILRASYSSSIAPVVGQPYLAIRWASEDPFDDEVSLLIDNLHVKDEVVRYRGTYRSRTSIFYLPAGAPVNLQIRAESPSGQMYRFVLLDMSWVASPEAATRLLVSDVMVRVKQSDRAPLEVEFAPRLLEVTLSATSDLVVGFANDWRLNATSELLVSLTAALAETLDATSDLVVTLSAPPVVLTATSELLVTFSERLAVTLDAVSDLLVTLISPPVFTETENRVGGRIRTGYGIATWTPDVVPAPAPVTVGGVVVGGARMAAAAYGPVTMQGATPSYSTSWADAPQARTRILYGGKDITYFRDVVTPDVTYGLAEPLLYGPGVLFLPQVSGLFEEPGVDPGIKWLKMGKEVIVQLVDENDVVVDEVYKGLSVAWVPDGTGVTVELGGEAQGRAALMGKEPPIFRDWLDIGRLAWRAIRSLGLPFEPRIGPVTGIESATFGSDSLVSYIDELCARGWTRAGAQWTIMPDETGVYRMQRKDEETIHFTVFTDDSWSIPALRRDLAEEPNRIYATGITPAGQRVRFGVYPGLQQGKVPPYPMAGDADFGLGTTNEDTIDGFGISVMVNRLWTMGYLSLGEKPGGYDDDVALGVRAVQDDAGLPETGVMNVASWRALWDLDKTGYSLRGSSIQPAAQKGYTRPYRRSGSGAVIGRNRNYDPHRPKVDRHVDMGPGFRRGQIREWAEAKLVGEENYVGSITISTGAVLAGVVDKGAVVTPEMLRDTRWIKPGMNAWLPMFMGGIQVHVSAVDVAEASVTLTVDTQMRDAPEVWEIIARNRETRNDPARKRRGSRASGEVKDAIDPWDEVGGTLDNDVDLVEGWNIVQVVAGQEGTVSRLRLTVKNGEDGVEFACAVFESKVSRARLEHLVSEPLTEAGTERWEKKKVSRALRARGLLYAAGTNEEPCGYSPGRKTKDAPLSGLHTDDAGFSYRTGSEPVVYLAVWVGENATLSGGRVMWNLLEAGA